MILGVILVVTVVALLFVTLVARARRSAESQRQQMLMFMALEVASRAQESPALAVKAPELDHTVLVPSIPPMDWTTAPSEPLATYHNYMAEDGSMLMTQTIGRGAYRQTYLNGTGRYSDLTGLPPVVQYPDR